ncbi:MAG: M6 family metalloprotease domain-containing protein [Chitinophagaceae bacterium]
MNKKRNSALLDEITTIHTEAQKTDDGNRCMIAPAPELKKKIDDELKKLKNTAAKGLLAGKIGIRNTQPVGFNDGLIYPGTMFPVGTSASIARSAGLNRAPLRGTVRVIVVLVDFSDKVMTQTKAHFEQLFFSLGSLATGSVREYYREVTHGMVDIQGQVVGTYRMPKTMAQYAHGASGTGGATPNARTMAKDAAVASNPAVNYALYDNDGDGFVDAFVVIHAGTGAEVTGSVNDIWSHKWTIDGGAYTADGTTKIYGYLTVPEDCKLGVCAHELGHLLFGFPDLYDTDNSSEGIGNWCLMASGSWNNGGLTPSHPSAWCKCQQGWVTTVNQTTNQNNVAIEDVKQGYKVLKMFKNGVSTNEYFLVENRQKILFDKYIPNSGLLIWHIDDSVAGNTNESHYKVALMQADGKKDLELNHNRGDAGDSYPGTSGNTKFNNTSTPNSKSYAGSNTCVGVNNISAPAAIMHADLAVKCTIVKVIKDKDVSKDLIKEKELAKDIKNEKIEHKEIKEIDKSLITDKATAHDKQLVEKQIDTKLADNKLADNKLTEGGLGRPGGLGGNLTVEQRLAQLEAQLGFMQPFIDQSIRPDLSQGALQGEQDDE